MFDIAHVQVKRNSKTHINPGREKYTYRLLYLSCLSPLADQSSCHNHTAMAEAAVQGANCSSGALWSSVSCSRMLTRAARDSSRRPSDYWTPLSTCWATAILHGMLWRDPEDLIHLTWDVTLICCLGCLLWMPGLSGVLWLSRPYPNGTHHPSFYQVRGEYSNVMHPISQKGFKVILFSVGNRHDYREILF